MSRQLAVSRSLRQAGAQIGPAGVVDHLDRALLAIDAEPQLVELAGRRAARLDRADRAVGEIDIHGEAVIGVEIVFADLVARRLVEGLQPAEDMRDIEARAVGREVDDVDADVAERAVRPVLLRQPPEPFALGLPVAPGLADQPALKMRRLDMAHGADLAGEHHLPPLLQRRRVAVGEVDHADQAGLLDRLGHLHGLGRRRSPAAFRRRRACRRRSPACVVG